MEPIDDELTTLTGFPFSSMQGTLWSLNISAALQAIASKAQPQTEFGPMTSPFALLHNFAGGMSDGATPFGPVTLSADGSYFIGMTFNGGPDNVGVVYSQSTTPGGDYRWPGVPLGEKHFIVS